MRFLGVHEAVVGLGDVLALLVGSVFVVLFVQGRADDPAYLVLVLVEDFAYHLAERGVARPNLWILDGRSVFLEMPGRRALLAAIPGVSCRVVVDRTCSLRCVHFFENLCWC